MNTSIDHVIDEIFKRFAERGHMAYGEDVTELEHALQTATFAERDGQPASLIVACLLHDYGHLCHDMGEHIADDGVDARHEELGAAALSEWFPPEVVEPGRLHVAAKRYLCTVDAAYYQDLSPASMQSLKLQGGKMSREEVAAFEAMPYFKQAVALRHYDDMGKIPRMETPDLEHFRPVIADVLENKAVV